MRCHLTAARLRQFEFECKSGPYMSTRWAMLRHSGKEVVRRDAILRRRRNSYASGGAFRPYEPEDLRKLGALTKQKPPTRKGDLAAVILQHLEGDRLQT